MIKKVLFYRLIKLSLAFNSLFKIVYPSNFMYLEEQYYQCASFGDKCDIVNKRSVSEFPYNCIGALYYNDGGDRQFIGTGFLIASNLVLTVAHNIYPLQYKKEIPKENLQFFIGVSGDLPDQGHKVADYRYPPEFRSAKASDVTHDYALIRLDGGISRPQYIELGLQYSNVVAEQLGIIGYQGGSCGDSLAIQKRLWKANTHSVSGNMLLHKLTTEKGNSGSPMLVKRKGPKGVKEVAVAIMKGSPSSRAHNEARIITRQLLLNLNVWKFEMCPQIGYYAMSQRATLTSADQQHEWIEDRLRTITEAIAKIKQSKPPLPNPPESPAKHPKVAIKDEVIEGEDFGDIADQLEKMDIADRKKVTVLRLIQTYVRTI